MAQTGRCGASWVLGWNLPGDVDVRAEGFGIGSRPSDVSAEGQRRRRRGKITARMDAIVANGTVLILPTTPGPPVAVDSTAEVVQAYRERQLALAAAAGMADAQITAPAGVVDGAPIGLSLIGARGTDKAAQAGVRAVGVGRLGGGITGGGWAEPRRSG